MIAFVVVWASARSPVRVVVTNACDTPVVVDTPDLGLPLGPGEAAEFEAGDGRSFIRLEVYAHPRGDIDPIELDVTSAVVLMGDLCPSI